MGMANLTKIANNFTGGLSAEVSASADAQRNMLVAAGNPGYFETRRRGDGWTVQNSTAQAAIAALPTTTAHMELYNNGARLAVVSDLHLWRLVGTAVGLGEVLFAMISTQKAVPTLTAQVLYSMCGKAAVTPTATSEMVTGIGTTVIATAWQPYGFPAAYLGAATPGTGSSVPIDGKLIIPPGCSLCLAVIASVNTASAFHFGVTFDWVSASIEL
jgi:hypothetical protein